MDIHFHWFTTAALIVAELITALSLRSMNRLPVFRCYLIAAAFRAAFPYMRFADTPWLDGLLLLARMAATAEFFFELGWRILWQDKTWMLACVGLFQVVAVLLLYDFPVQPDATHPWFVLTRQIVHVELFIGAITAALWVWYHDKRRTRFAMIHGVLLSGYLFNYVTAGFWIAKWPADRCPVLATWDVLTMGLLGLWIVAARSCEEFPLMEGR
jgi:hypothetical protein